MDTLLDTLCEGPPHSTLVTTPFADETTKTGIIWNFGNGLTQSIQWVDTSGTCHALG